MNESKKLEIKKAAANDAGIILDFIKRLAEYEKLSHEMTADESSLLQTVFSADPKAEALIGYFNKQPVCFAIYFYNYSTFKGKYGLYLEDLFVLPEYRGFGFGKEMLIHLASIAEKNNCGRFEWSVLDWNEPAINFYKNLGAFPLEDWTVFRLDEEGIKRLSAKKKD